MCITRIKEIEARLAAALQDKSFYLRVNTWLTAGDGRDFCAHAPDDMLALITALREAREVIEFYAEFQNFKYLREDENKTVVSAPIGEVARAFLEKWA